MILSIIVAVSENNVIGKDNKLIWHLPADMKFFKDKTSGHFIITGRKNYDSIPEKFRPLSNRTNIVVTRQKNYHAPFALVMPDIETALTFAKEKSEEGEVFIIGGAEIYRQTIDVCSRIYLTRIHHSFEGDAFFPELNMKDWNLLSSKHHAPDEKNKYAFTIETLERKH